MNDKEIAELRRRLHPERHSITKIYGCYVSEEKEIIATFAQSPGLMPQDETEKYLALFKRSLSGSNRKNLVDICFSTKQVADSDEHRLLMKLRETRFQDENTRRELCEKIIEAQPMDGNYVILMLHNSYDVPFKAKDGSELDDSSETVFSYIQCCLCPVKLTKSTLLYDSSENEFHNSIPGWVISPPEVGFLFPAFDDRATNIYNALLYTHDTADNHETLVDALFHTDIPMPAAEQKTTFQSVLGNALDEDCSLAVVKEVHTQLSQMIQIHKESKVAEPLAVTGDDVKAMLESSGVDERHTAAFGIQFATEFGSDADLSPKNIIDPKKFEVVTPEVSIKIDPERTDLIETRVLGGVKYLLIRADEAVEVNGVPIHISE